MRLACMLALLLCVSASASEGAPVAVYISQYGTEVDGVAYKSPDAAMQALKNLNPTAVHFVPIQGVSYEEVYAVLDAYLKSGIAAPTGFVGNIRK